MVSSGARFVFSPIADKALDKIWQYTEAEWGRAQAETYVREMMTHLGAVAEKRHVWRVLPRKLVVPLDLDMDVYMSRYGKHVIFFRELPSRKVGVLAILHEKMDMPARLAGDLRKLDAGTG
ncbi:type II toxin-antitoxin system RelE/ParE family toxin [Kordiimonas pumila]|uniref:Type II toxin-antitoxin system RelE/ParE family toxin n=1 Tax=Kordiimonas pumila TaxID=2161677 RepID=A0ABV7D353_9PROT|nr:type II toxin-antitoxin system RelE/ParE family toxin [Kordiimonas pumila]